MDFEAAAKRALPSARWGYMATGVDDDVKRKANHEAFGHYRLLARRLVDASKPDLRTELFGQTWESPIFISPCGSQRAFHNYGERAQESRLATINCLAEVVDGAGPMPVMLDCGIRRGTDAYRALALGARAVALARHPPAQTPKVPISKAGRCPSAERLACALPEPFRSGSYLCSMRSK
jgi:isopentenyl diphosphate isomerase/L-lactate dehydrogenase-like FMN-dependent dehydrogenase